MVCLSLSSFRIDSDPGRYELGGRCPKCMLCSAPERLIDSCVLRVHGAAASTQFERWGTAAGMRSRLLRRSRDKRGPAGDSDFPTRAAVYTAPMDTAVSFINGAQAFSERSSIRDDFWGCHVLRQSRSWIRLQLPAWRSAQIPALSA